MDKESIHKLISEFIEKNKLATLSTVTADGKPEAAAIEFGGKNNFELIFDTIDTYRKYKNLQSNKNVAFVIGWDDDVTVQYEGIAQELSGDELEEYKKKYFEKNPKAKKWENVKGIRYFKVIPKWIRYSDLKKNPWEIHELRF